MAELVDAHDSKSCAFGRAGSIPALGTLKQKALSKKLKAFFLVLKHLHKTGSSVARRKRVETLGPVLGTQVVICC